MKLRIGELEYDVQTRPGTVTVDGVAFKVQIENSANVATITVNGRPYKVEVGGKSNSGYSVLVDGKAYQVLLSKAVREGQAPPFAINAGAHRAPDSLLKGKSVTAPGAVAALMPGKVVAVKVQAGDQVEAGTVLLVLEAMKMENEIRAPQSGKIASILVTEGTNVDKGEPLIVLE
ncbi:MAG: biotin/lipoyl-binding protein [Chloroflexi bacterium]|nr:biotin/lipoyl-binding protein [Chloroflexota bacterium]